MIYDLLIESLAMCPTNNPIASLSSFGICKIILISSIPVSLSDRRRNFSTSIALSFRTLYDLELPENVQIKVMSKDPPAFRCRATNIMT